MSTTEIEKSKRDYLRKVICQLFNEKYINQSNGNIMATMDIKTLPIICEKITVDLKSVENPNIVITPSFDQKFASYYLKITDFENNGLRIDIHGVNYLGQINAGFYHRLRKFDIDSLIN